jgi:hypothetical protein
MTEIKAYVCEFCPRKKARMSKSRTAKHESICFYNPERKACATCGNLERYEEIYNTLHDGQDFEHSYFVQNCKVDYFNVIQPEAAPWMKFRFGCDKWIERKESDE